MTSITPRKAVDAKEFGKYRVLATIARGGMAYVHLAASRGDHGFTKVVVVKEILEELSADPGFRTMFAQEARVAAQLSHPNIVTTFEADAQSERLYMVMEYLDGQPLNRVRKKLGGPAHLPHHLHVLSNVLEALSYAHTLRGYDGTELNIVHRDVTPHNVFVTYAGEVKLVDFGIAKVVRNGADTKVGTVKGKLAYMPPEQARGVVVDHRADLFSVGVILWETFTGRRMWGNVEEVDAFRMLLEGRLPDVKTALSIAPKALADIILRALSPDAASRYESADAMRADLDAFRRTLSVVPDRSDLGRLVAEHFSMERGQSNALIREQLAAASAAATGEFVAQSYTGHGSNPFVPPDASGRFVGNDAITLGTPPPASAMDSVAPPVTGGGLKRGLAAFTIVLSLGVAGLMAWLLIHVLTGQSAAPTKLAALSTPTVVTAPQSATPTPTNAEPAAVTPVVAAPVGAGPSASVVAISSAFPAVKATPAFQPWPPPQRKWNPTPRASASTPSAAPAAPTGGVDLGY